MPKPCLPLAVVAVALCFARPSPLRADDTIKKVTGESLKGNVKGMSPTEVTLEKAAGVEEQVPVAEIDVIRFGEEPASLNLVRNHIAKGSFENALKALDKLDPNSISRAEIKQDLQFYRALASARSALSGGGDVREAGGLMLAFIKENPNNYHVLPANEVVGDLLVAAKKYGDAEKYYAEMAQTTFPEYKMRAGVALGRALVAQKKFPQALTYFETALAEAAKARPGPVVEAQRQVAMLGKATCLAETDQVDEAVRLVEEEIAKIPAEDAELHGRAYVTLGNCHRKKPGATKPALLAYLHVDLLYSSATEAHAEALHHLAVLWNELGQPDRAAQAAETLKERYATSTWAK